MESSLGNIASLQEGFRLKRQICDEQFNEYKTNSNRSASNLLRAGYEEEEKNKASKQFYFDDVRRHQERLRDRVSGPVAYDVSAEFGDDNDAPAFSTPVRASFRRRPRTMIEDARTPSKVDSRHARLRGIKTRQEQQRCNRWSSPVGTEDVSSVGWSQFANFEASVPEFSELATPAMMPTATAI